MLPRISISWSDVELLPVQGPLAFTLSYPYAVERVPFGCSPPRVVSLDNFTYLPGRADAPSGNGLLIFIFATSVFQCGALPWPPHGCRCESSTASPLPSVGSRGGGGPLSRASEILSFRNSMYFSQLCVDWPAHSSGAIKENKCDPEPRNRRGPTTPRPPPRTGDRLRTRQTLNT